MKKYIIIATLFITLMLGANKALAASFDYVNLIDTNQVQYNEVLDVFYSTQKIELKKDLCYTLVASSEFFGNETKTNHNALSSRTMGTKFTSLDGGELLFNLPLVYSNSGIYYSSVTPSEDCYLEFTDFLTKGYTVSTLPKDKIQFFIGQKEEFRGFRENEYIENYGKITNTINIYTSCLKPISVDEIVGKIKVYDNVDGFNGSVTLVSDNYQNNNTVGIYEMVFKSIDKSNNETTLVVKVNVVDTAPPTISGPDVIEFDCFGDSPSPEEIIRAFSAYDEVDGYLSNKITIQSSGLVMYQWGKTKDYTVVIAVTDKSGNKTTKNVTLRAKDITAPTLEVRDVEIKLSELGKTLFENFFEQTIGNVSDNSNKYFIEYEAVESLGEFGFSGVYEITVIVKDEALNSTTKKAYITVVDDIAPEFYMHTDLLTLTTDEAYTLEEIKQLINDSLYEDGILFDSVNLISCDYINNEQTPGKYSAKYSYSYKGETNYMVLGIEVTEPEQPSYYWLLLLLLVPVVIGIVIVNKRRENSY